MKFFIRTLLGLSLVILTGSAVNSPSKSNQLYVSNFENVLGTSLEIKIQAASPADAEIAETAAINEIDRLEKILSTYDKNSEASKWLNSVSIATPVSPELFEVLSLFDKWRLRTNGALDASAEVVSRVWKTAAAKQQIPSSTELIEAVNTVKQSHWQLNSTTHTATHLDHSPLVFNSFTKSYIINKAAQAASKSANVTAVVVNIGGDMVIKGTLTEPVRISDPTADAENDPALTQLLIHNKAVATSGNYRRGVQIGDHWYSHIVDPRTGHPADHIISATVVALNASDAGALATAFNVLSTEESLKLLSSIPDAEALLITREGKRIESTGWKKLEGSVKNTATKEGKAYAGSWNTNYELAINIEIAKIEGARIHSPFIAVWVEDENKKPIRNIALWYSKPKWLPDLKSWNRGNGEAFSDPEKIGSISSATRPAGKYTLKWDGKDDNGALVKSGTYTIYIEAAREHGTHQLMSSEMHFANSANQINLTGNVEIASASLDYRKKSKAAR
jgi:thiamine biosynthesis lipoprotein